MTYPNCGLRMLAGWNGRAHTWIRHHAYSSRQQHPPSRHQDLHPHLECILCLQSLQYCVGRTGYFMRSGWLVMGVVGVQCNLTTKSGGVWKFWKTKACKDNGEVLKLKKESKLNENAKIIIHGRNVGNPKILNDKRITWLGGEWEQEWNVYYTD